jgi:hypothetical protein
VLEKAKGRIEVRAVNEGIRLAEINGDLSAESTNGSIVLDRIDSGNVDLYTVNGNISYDGPIKDKGLYRLTTHNGTIGIALADRANAMLTVRTYNGGFRSSFPLKLDDQNPRKRFTVTLGNGSAHVELESFGGTILLRRPGEPRPEVERDAERKRARERREKDKEKEKDQAAATIDRAVREAMLEAQPEIDRAMLEVQPEIDQAVRAAMAEISIPAAPHADAVAVAHPDAPPTAR